ncbi:replication termination factor 2 [Patella vulgata]|uniref:replication termination factor 2 n=1 Tax=Patella vulgata TaxID=6465 RepID=UPI00218036BD|nr:replication termination factor 2 [Patella vulgata]
MGCDGGTIPTRDELVKTKKKPEQKDKASELAVKWKHCSISLEPLHKPILACELGRLYNKESVLEFLIDKSKFDFADQFNHLRGLRDLKELNLSENPAFKGIIAEKGDAYIDTQTSEYICPVVGTELSGKYRFCYIWTCGCVLSERALKEIKSEVCHKCGHTYEEESVVVLNGTDDDVDLMRIKMEARRLKAKQEKKAKKAGKHKATSSSTDLSTDGEPSSKLTKREKDKEVAVASSSKVDVKSKLINGKPDLKSKPSRGKAEEKTIKSIQNDPNASATYKSLFTTSSRAKNQQQAHWVTFNPMYY